MWILIDHFPNSNLKCGLGIVTWQQIEFGLCRIIVMSAKEGEMGSFNYARPFDGSGGGKGFEGWRDMLYAESLAKSLDHVFDGKIPTVPGLSEDGSNKAIVKMREKAGPIISRSAENNYDALLKYGVDFTQQAEEGKLDPVIGRDDEIRRAIQILSRRRKNNPVLIGDPGGKYFI